MDFADAFGADFIPAGVGWGIVIGAGKGAYSESLEGRSE